MYKFTYSCMYYTDTYMYQYSYKCVHTNKNTRIKCNYVFSDKSPLLLVVNKKSSKTLSALA